MTESLLGACGYKDCWPLQDVDEEGKELAEEDGVKVWDCVAFEGVAQLGCAVDLQLDIWAVRLV